VSAISAYNYPTQLNLAKLGPALAGGCTVVLKGARHTPLITLALGRLIAERTDIPPGVVNVLASSAVEPGVVMTTDPDVDMVTFTGSTAVGRSIMAAASETLKKTFLELGGKSALVVAVAKRIRTGTVSVNGGMWLAPDAPVGGYKQSGIGRELGNAGLDEYRETKHVWHNIRPAVQGWFGG
jgi:acyl-CoA reductase-like NAD-dependent aldehyde dehydrogenase